MHIFYGFTATPLGTLVAAATKKGVCYIGIQQSEEKLVADITARFPSATLARDDTAVASPLADLHGFIVGTRMTLDFPVDEVGTPFQRKVWRALRAIPYGTTLTYSDLASVTRIPNAVRAVASACAANPLALYTPCHRIIRKNGELGGYYWGVYRKKILLEMEGRGVVSVERSNVIPLHRAA